MLGFIEPNTLILCMLFIIHRNENSEIKILSIDTLFKVFKTCNLFNQSIQSICLV